MRCVARRPATSYMLKYAQRKCGNEKLSYSPLMDRLLISFANLTTDIKRGAMRVKTSTYICMLHHALSMCLSSCPPSTNGVPSRYSTDSGSLCSSNSAREVIPLQSNRMVSYGGCRLDNLLLRIGSCARQEQEKAAVLRCAIVRSVIRGRANIMTGWLPTIMVQVWDAVWSSRCFYIEALSASRGVVYRCHWCDRWHCRNVRSYGVFFPKGKYSFRFKALPSG